MRKKISRREFSRKIAGVGVGLAAGSLVPSLARETKVESFNGGFIDVHHHLGKEPVENPEKLDLNPILGWMDLHNVSQTVILSPVLYPSEYYSGYGRGTIDPDILLEKFQATRGRLLPFCVVHYDAYKSEKKITGILEDVKKKGVIGFGELKPRDKAGEPGNMTLDDPAMMRLYAACAKVEFPVLLHIDNRFAVDSPGLPAMERVLKEFPEVNFIGHANGWWNSISGDVTEFRGYPKEKITPGGAAGRLLEEYPNMYADLSAGSGLNAITRDPEVGREFLIKHADKLMFGTDALGGEGRESHFDFYNDIELPKDVKAKLCRDNAKKLLKI